MLDAIDRTLPISIDEIDRAWLTAALGTYAPGVRVEDFEILEMKRATCTKIWLRLGLNAAGREAGIPERVVLKGGFEPHSREMHYMHGHEVRGYRDLLPHLGLRRPACYFADYDPEQRQGIVILEDLTARGVSFCNPLVPHTHDAVARRLGDLAGFHARSWDSPDFRPGGRWDWLLESAPDTRRYIDFFSQQEWDSYVRSPRGAASSVRFHSREWMSWALDRLVVLGECAPHALLHGDTHLGNLYVEPDGAPGFLDAVPNRGPVMMDVSYHIGCALDPADRRRWEGALVGHYLDELGRAGVAAPGFDEAMRQYGAGLVRGYFIFLINESVFQLESVNTAYTARFSAAMIDNDTQGLLEALA